MGHQTEVIQDNQAQFLAQQIASHVALGKSMTLSPLPF